MYELSPELVKLIVLDVNRENISYSHLREDLIDHVCCELEWEMEQGLSFNEAFKNVRQKIGIHGLRKIQAETLYVVDSKYRFMKKTMKISGVIGTVLLGFAALFKIMHWPGASIMISLGALALNFLFLPSSLSVLYKESKSGKRILLFLTSFLAGFCFITGVLFKIQHWPGANIAFILAVIFAALLLPQILAAKLKEPAQTHKKAVYIVGFVSAYVYLFGMLFKFQNWPGASILLFFGAIFLFMVAFPWYAWITYKEENFMHTTFIFLVSSVIWVLVSSGLINLRLSYDYLGGFTQEFDRQEAITKYMLQWNNQLVTQVKDTVLLKKVTAIHHKSQELYSQIEQLKVRMVQSSPNTPVTAGSNDPNYISDNARSQFDSQTPKEILAGYSPDRKKLEQDVAAFQGYLVQESGTHTVLAEAIGNLVVPAVCLPDTGNRSFMILGTCLNQLSMLQNSVLISESQVLNYLQKAVVEPQKTK